MNDENRHEPSDPPTYFSKDDKRAPWVLAFLVLVGLMVSAMQPRSSWELWVLAGPLGLLYLVVMIRFGDRLIPTDPVWKRAAYFVIQLLIMVATAYLFVSYRLFGTQWLLFMPLISQARILLSKPASWLIALASLVILSVHVGLLGGWEEVPQAMIGISTAVVFVILFTDIAIKENTARQVSQRLSAQLEKANRRLGEYAVQAEELAGARERTRVAREIHDSLGHSLTAVHMQLEAARTILDHDQDKARQALEKAQSCIKDGLTEIRASVSSLRSDPLEGRSLPQALNDLAQVSSDSGLTARLKLRGRQRPLTGDVVLTLYRCAQEGLTNARKHAEASQVDVRLDFGESWDDGIRLTIQDDGVGLDPEILEAMERDDDDHGFGLLGLRERIRQQSGELHIGGGPGEGLQLEVHLPTAMPADPHRDGPHRDGPHRDGPHRAGPHRDGPTGATS